MSFRRSVLRDIAGRARAGVMRLGLCVLFGWMAGCSGGSKSSSSEAADAPATPPPAPPPAPPPSEPPPGATVAKVLGLYTPDVQSRYGDVDLRLQHVVQSANDVFAASGLSLVLDLDHLELVDYPPGAGVEAALDDVTFGNHPSVANVAALRDSTESDLVVLFRMYANDGFCGFAWVGGPGSNGDLSSPADADHAYSVVAADCDDYTLLHEVGHNMGLVHSRRSDPDGGSLPYGAGHGVDNGFVTVMGQPSEFNAVQLPVLSTPLRTCQQQPCGVAHDDAVNGADAVRAIGVSMSDVAAYR